MALDENLTAGETGHIAAHATLKSEYDAAGATPAIAAYATSSTAAQHATIHNALAARHNALGSATTLPTNLTGTSSGFLAYETALNKAYNLRQAPPTSTQNIFTTQTPTTANANDGQGVSVGTRFSSDIDGTVTGIRFYRATTAPTSVVGVMYSDAGDQLASVAFSALSPGWNSATFSAPVSITSGTVYRISYWSNGPYVYSSTALPVTNGHLTAIDGRWGYAESPIYPNNQVSSNYFADVAFAPVSASATVPATPTTPVAVAGNTSAAVSWAAPSSGGSAITGYEVQRFAAGVAGAVTNVGLTTSVTLSGLTNGTVYTFKVRASNAVGASGYSAASNSVTPSVSASTYPNATTTGVPSGTTLTAYTGPTTITTNGTTIDSKLITAGLVIRANNVTIKNCKIQSNGYYWLVLNDNNNTGLVIQDTEIDGQNNITGDACVAGDNYTLLRCNVHGTPDGIKVGDQVTIQDCYIHDMAVAPPPADPHNDGIQCLGTAGLTIVHNTITMAVGATSCVILSTGVASAMRNILINDNLMTGGAYCVYGGYQSGVDNAAIVSNISVTNNKISTAVNPNGGSFGPFASCDPPVVLSGNVWYDGPNAGQSAS